MLIQCFEPQGQPRRAALELGEETRFAVYTIQDTLVEEAKGLRSTVLRKADQAPPPKSQFVAEFDIRRKRSGEAPGFRVVRVGRAVQLEWIRHDGRSRVTTSTDLRNGARFEVTMGDLSSVIFALEVATEIEQGAGATVGGRGPSGGPAMQGVAAYVIPVVAALLSDPWSRAKGAVVQAMGRLGLSPALIVPALITGTVMIGAIATALISYGRANDLQGENDKLRGEKDQAVAGRDAALIAESACVSERQSLAKALDDVEEARKLQAEVALAIPMAQSVAVELGGPRMATEAALAYDLVAVKNVKDLVVAEMGKKRKSLSDPAPCRGQIGALGQDLPEYVLLWHPMKEYQCPENFVYSDMGVDRAGPWGLSKRAATEFGAPQDLSASVSAAFGEAPEDPRLGLRWSGAADAAGLREVMGTILDADTGERPPVSPGQAHLWALAIWDAYNQLTSDAGGTMDKSAEECVKDLITQVVKAGGPAEPGQPVLPDISRVVLGESIALKPSAGCPWPANALDRASKDTVEAVTRLALVQLQELEDQGS